MAKDKYNIHPALFISELYNFFEEYYSPKRKKIVVINLSKDSIDDILSYIKNYPNCKIHIGEVTFALSYSYNGIYHKDDIFIITRPCITENFYPNYLYSGWRNFIKEVLLEYMYENTLENVVTYISKNERADLESKLALAK